MKLFFFSFSLFSSLALCSFLFSLSLSLSFTAVSSEAASRDRERTALLTRVEDLQARLAAAQSDIEMGTRDREDLMTTYRMVISERATLEHAVTKLGEQRDHVLQLHEETKGREQFLKSQLTMATKELQKYSIALQERERRESEMTEINQHLENRMLHSVHGSERARGAVERSREATAAMAQDAETLRYDNARLLQLADAARARIEELEHRLRVAEVRFFFFFFFFLELNFLLRSNHLVCCGVN